MTRVPLCDRYDLTIPLVKRSEVFSYSYVTFEPPGYPIGCPVVCFTGHMYREDHIQKTLLSIFCHKQAVYS
eukprot:jgi/Galph1/3406/GphlegSOOS_G2120.1